MAAYHQGGFAGIGYVFTESGPHCGVDFDHCRDPEAGEVAPWALEKIHEIGSYAEISFSGTGVHIARASGPENRKVNGIEIYDRKRSSR